MLPKGSREMNHIIMNNNMPYPWYSLCLVINSNDLAGDFASIVGVLCRVKHALLPCVTFRRPARTPTASLSIHAYTVNGTRIHVDTSLASSGTLSISTITYIRCT